MAEDTQQAQNEPVPEPQDSPMPSETETAEEVTEQSSTQPEGLPEDAKERTRREFDKLQTQLREERSQRMYYEQLFSQMQPQEQQQFIDPNTGLPDEQALASLSKQTQEALKAANDAKKATLEYQRNQENQAVYTAHPELNPDGKSFNKDLHVLARSVALQSMVSPDDFGGKELTFMEAAEYAKKLYKAGGKEAATEAIEQLTPKEQASLDAVGSPSRRSSIDDLEDLRLKSRGRDEEARLARIERFKRITGQE